MGMFNDIGDLKELCPECRKELRLQTKDDFVDPLCLKKVSFKSVRYFNALCTNCRVEITYILKEDWGKRTLEDYLRTEGNY